MYDAKSILYNKPKSIDEFNWDNITNPPIYAYMYDSDVEKLYNIATSVRYSGNIKMKKNAIYTIMRSRGFERMFSGTNRICFKYYEDNNFIAKVGFDRVGVEDAHHEYDNQFKICPGCTKIFDWKGGVSIAERVYPIRYYDEFLQVSDQIYSLLTKKIIGKYVLSDIGASFYQNYGIRPGFGPVLLDFPYVYELDGAKLRCNAPSTNGRGICNGEIDYDDGFDRLVCTKCGKMYMPKQLEKKITNKEIVYLKGDTDNMDAKVSLYFGDELYSVNEITSSDTIQRRPKNRKKRNFHYKDGKENEPINNIGEVISKEDLDREDEEIKVEVKNKQQEPIVEEPTDEDIQEAYADELMNLKMKILTNSADEEDEERYRVLCSMLGEEEYNEDEDLKQQEQDNIQSFSIDDSTTLSTEQKGPEEYETEEDDKILKEFGIDPNDFDPEVTKEKIKSGNAKFDSISELY